MAFLGMNSLLHPHFLHLSLLQPQPRQVPGPVLCVVHPIPSNGSACRRLQPLRRRLRHHDPSSLFLFCLPSQSQTLDCAPSSVSAELSPPMGRLIRTNSHRHLFHHAVRRRLHRALSSSPSPRILTVPLPLCFGCAKPEAPPLSGHHCCQPLALAGSPVPPPPPLFISLILEIE